MRNLYRTTALPKDMKMQNIKYICTDSGVPQRLKFHNSWYEKYEHYLIQYLIWAAEQANIEKMQRLIEELDVNVGSNSLLFAVIRADKLKSAAFLLDNGADLNIRDENGNTSLIYTVVEENEEISRLLLEYGTGSDLGGYKNNFYTHNTSCYNININIII